MITGRDALDRLREGNRRFVATGGGSSPVLSPPQRAELAKGQAPFAVVLGCADSRVPPEGVFDTGLGELFVIRVAGNIVTPSQIGSIEFAVQEFGAPLVVVLGHSRCGAVTATVEVVRGSGAGMSPGLMAIVDRIRPAVEEVLAAHAANDLDTVVAHAVRANVRAVASSLCEASELIASRVRDDALLVIGAEYALETGAVEFSLSQDAP